MSDLDNLSEQEKEDLAEILQMLRTLRASHGGWGVIDISVKGGEVDEIGVRFTLKPKKKGRGTSQEKAKGL